MKQLLLHTGAREVHVGSVCQESVPGTVPHQGPAVRLGFVREGVWVTNVSRAKLCTPKLRLTTLLGLMRCACRVGSVLSGTFYDVRQLCTCLEAADS